MPKTKKIVKTIESYFYKRRAHTAGILSGPKRETWFSAECFAALAERKISKEGPLTYWGELSHGTIAKALNAKLGKGRPSKIPDMAAILPADRELAVGTIVENKLIRADEKPESILKGLRTQMVNAERCWPGTSIVGLIFIAGVTHAKEPKYNKVLKEVVAAVEGVFAGVQNFRWINHDKVHRIFDETYTEFAYPAMHFSLALCAIELSSALLPLDDAVCVTRKEKQTAPSVLRSLRTRPETPKPHRSPKWNSPSMPFAGNYIESQDSLRHSKRKTAP
ncbi:hypothetical protein [Edaphobacter dinghuensis]|uniref:Uncharacterized protein n=1 Tax=Edaphobacter dinghuensis TaxID=1560005 RepID=A0A917HRX1_9BACT|nr:hypothetical protein [Edaphobacter dinghuensis]GGG87497.1 hypothetical protein GCM10011585_34490 [Edaphobacter dinghuensis]